MANNIIEKAIMIIRDDYDPLVEDYTYLDLAKYNDTWYVAKLRNTIVPVGTLPSNADFWSIYAVNGANGTNGTGVPLLSELLEGSTDGVENGAVYTEFHEIRDPETNVLKTIKKEWNLKPKFSTFTGGLINSNGSLNTTTSVKDDYSFSDKIPFVENIALFVYVQSYGDPYLSLAFYDENDTLLLGYLNSQTTEGLGITSPAKTAYYRIALDNATYTDYYIKVQVDTPSWGTLVDNLVSYLNLRDVVRYATDTANSVINDRKMTYLADQNLINLIDTYVSGYYFDDGSPNVGGGGGTYQMTTQKTYVTEGQVIDVDVYGADASNVAVFFAFDTNGVIISDTIVLASETFGGNVIRKTMPANAYYYVVCGKIATWDDAKISNVNEILFVPFSPLATKEYVLEKTYRSATSIEPHSPPHIYTVCNDIDYENVKSYGYTQRNYCAALFIDRCFDFTSVTPVPSVLFDNRKDRMEIYSPISGYQRTFNSETIQEGVDSIPKITIQKSLALIDSNSTIDFEQRSSSATNGKDSDIRLLVIGDSITNKSGADYEANLGDATVFWAWLKRMFEMDKIDGGDIASEYNLLTLGAQSYHQFDFEYKGVSRTDVRTMAEGRSGWDTIDYCENEWRNGEIGNYSGYNFFYDETEAGVLKFSLDKYLEHYRTLDDSGVRLADTDPALGDRILDTVTYDALSADDSKKFRDFADDWNVCTPTHIIIQLGTNDASAATATANIQSIITKIRTEGYTNIKIGVAFPGQAGTYYPHLYPNISNENIFLGGGAELQSFNEAYSTLENSGSNQYYIPISYTQPTAECVTIRPINHPASLLGGNNNNFGVEFGNVPEIHPNTRAHLTWAYQYYGWLKWVAI